MAPGLVQAHEKYRDRGVRFVSLTDMSKQTSEAFVREFAIPWPSGHGLSPDLIAKLGVVNSGMNLVPGYDIAPTIYIVGADGKVVWSDGSSRHMHMPAVIGLSKLERAIEDALK